MEYKLRDEILPTYFQIGYFALKHEIEIGKPSNLMTAPISALHYHHCIELGVCLSGSGETHIENRIYHFRQGDIQYIPPNTPHLSTAYEGEECRWIWIFIDYPKMVDTFDCKKEFTNLLDISCHSFSGVFSPHEHPELFNRITKLLESNQEDSFSNLDNFFMIGQIIIETTRIGNIDKSKSKLPISSQIKPALVYIRENYASPQMMSAEQIASSCNLSVSHFRALFKKDIGMTLPQYISQTRLSAANHLLETTKKPIVQIANETGFNEVSYFNKIFRRAYGTTPKEMRKRMQSRHR